MSTSLQPRMVVVCGSTPARRRGRGDPLLENIVPDFLCNKSFNQS
jgi:hypothetical protein